MKKNKNKHKKSIFIAKILSILLPGSGLIYTGQFLKGFLWMIPGISIILIIFFILLRINTILSEFGYDALFMSGWRGRPTDAVIILTIFYFIYSSYSSKEAVKSVIDHNLKVSTNIK